MHTDSLTWLKKITFNGSFVLYWDFRLCPLGQLLLSTQFLWCYMSHYVQGTKFRLFPYDMLRRAGGQQEGKWILCNNIVGSHSPLCSQLFLATPPAIQLAVMLKTFTSCWNDTVWNTDGEQFTWREMPCVLFFHISSYIWSTAGARYKNGII